MLGRQGYRRRARGHRRSRSRARRRDVRADPAPRRRAGGAADATRRSRSPAAASGRRRPAPAGSARRCGRCRSCWRSPSACASSPPTTPGSSTSPTRWGSSTRALLDAGHRAVGLCNVAIGLQRRSPRALASSPSGCRRPGRAQPPDLGPRGLARRRRRPARPAAPSRRRAGGHVGLPRALLERLGAIPSYYLRYFYSTTRCSKSSGPARRARPRWREIERELLELYRDPALTTKPALLERRGGAYYSEAATQLVAALATATAATSRWSTCGTTGRSPGCADDDVVEVPARIEAAGPRPLPQPPLAPELLGLVQHVAAYERLAARAAVGGDRDARLQGAARTSAGRPGAAGRRADRAPAARGPRAPAAVRRPERRRDAAARAGGRRRQLEDRPRARSGGRRVLALVRGPQSSPHHLGVDGCLAVLEGLLAEALRRARPPERRRAGRPTSASSCSPASTSRRGAGARVAAGRAGWRRASGRQRHLRRAARRHRARLGRRRRLRRRDQLRRRRARTAGRPGSRRWAGSPATGAAATTSVWRRVSAAARSDDGRGQRTTLEHAVPGALRATTPTELSEAFHRGSIAERRVAELAPVVFAEAEHDPVAAAIVDRLADEVVVLVRTALHGSACRRRGEVVLGGGLLEAGDPRLIGEIEDGLADRAGRDGALRARRLSSGPRCWVSTRSGTARKHVSGYGSSSRGPRE